MPTVRQARRAVGFFAAGQPERGDGRVGGVRVCGEKGDQGSQMRGEVGHVGQRLDSPAQRCGVEDVGDHGVHQVLFGREDAEDGAFGDPGGLGDLFDGELAAAGHQ